MKKVLVIDDDVYVRDALSNILTQKGFLVDKAENGLEGLKLIKERDYDVLLIDLVMPEMGGIELLRELNKENIDTLAIVITAFAAVDTAVEAMKLGAIDYITKPFNIDELIVIIEKAIKIYDLKKENTAYRRQLQKIHGFENIIGNSPKMQEIFSLISKVADSDATILITGESGTGKELIAKTIHYMSYRSKYPFVPINCGAIPKELLESEFFGYEKGAFTGAVATKKGRVELADRGTLFLDEIGELLLPLQVKLLRFIQEREFERVGGGKTLKVDVRIISATNRDLEKDVLDGKFREDLFYRLNVIPIHIPPLRERREDIPLLFNHFISKFCKKRKRPVLSISKDAMRCLESYHWPGNIRELENLCDRLSVLVSGNRIEIYDLPEKFITKDKDLYNSAIKLNVMSSNFVFPENGFDLNKVIDDFERKAIVEALKQAGGVKSKAATLLGLNRTTLLEKMKKMRISFDTGVSVDN